MTGVIEMIGMIKATGMTNVSVVALVVLETGPQERMADRVHLATSKEMEEKINMTITSRMNLRSLALGRTNHQY